MPYHLLSELRLLNFRNHRDMRMRFGTKLTVIVGNNGSGKTNILEAISLLSSRGIRNARIGDMILNTHLIPFEQSNKDAVKNSDEVLDAIDDAIDTVPSTKTAHQHHDPTPNMTDLRGFHIRATLKRAADYNHSRGSSLAMNTEQIDTLCQGDNHKRLSLMNGQRISAKQAARMLPLLCITPLQVNILTDTGGSGRRILVDDLCALAYPDIRGMLQRLNALQRQRVALLQQSNFDTTWCAILEQRIAEQSVDIYTIRLELLQRINLRIKSGAIRPCWFMDTPHFTRFFHSDDTNTDIPEPFSVMSVDDIVRTLAETREITRINKTTPIGPQSQSLTLVDASSRNSSHQHSTGQCKAMLLEIVLAMVDILRWECRSHCILLIDEFAAFFDHHSRHKVLNQLWTSTARYNHDMISQRGDGNVNNDGVVQKNPIGYEGVGTEKPNDPIPYPPLQIIITTVDDDFLGVIDLLNPLSLYPVAGSASGLDFADSRTGVGDDKQQSSVIIDLNKHFTQKL